MVSHLRTHWTLENDSCINFSSYSFGEKNLRSAENQEVNILLPVKKSNGKECSL